MRKLSHPKGMYILKWKRGYNVFKQKILSNPLRQTSTYSNTYLFCEIVYPGVSLLTDLHVHTFSGMLVEHPLSVRKLPGAEDKEKKQKQKPIYPLGASI